MNVEQVSPEQQFFDRYKILIKKMNLIKILFCALRCAINYVEYKQKRRAIQLMYTQRTLIRMKHASSVLKSCNPTGQFQCKVNG